MDRSADILIDLIRRCLIRISFSVASEPISDEVLCEALENGQLAFLPLKEAVSPAVDANQR